MGKYSLDNKAKRLNKSQIAWDYETTQSIQANISKLLKALDNDEILSKASVRDIGATVGVLFDRLRLARGESTQNIAISTRVEGIDRIASLAARLESVLTGSQSPPSRIQQERPALLAAAETETVECQLVAEPQPVKRKRGRPRKVPRPPV